MERLGGRAGPPALRLRRRWNRTGEAVLVLLAAAVPYLVVYQPWGKRWRIPVDASQDAAFHAMVVKTMVLRGGFRSTPDLGAPFGQQLSDFPLGGDHLHLLALRVLTLFEHDPFVVLNLYYAAGFLLVALSAHVVGRALGLRPVFAASVAVLFAYLPYHFWHHNARIFLSAYYAVPLAVLLAVWVAEDRVAWPGNRRPHDAGGPDPGGRARIAAVVACVLVLGSASPYYAVFALVIVGTMGVLGAARHRSARPLLAAAAIVAGISLVLLANLSPDLRWRARNGPNDQVAARTVAEIDRNGLRPTQMLLPTEHHRLGELVAAGPAARPTAPAEDSAYLGVLGATGFVLALGIALAGALGTRRFELPESARPLSTTALVAVLFGTVGGGGLLVAVLGFTQIRTWSRMTLVVGFCSLAVLGLCVQHLTRRVASGRFAAVVPVLAAAVVGLGLFEQVPRDARPPYDVVAAEQRSTREFVARMEAALPARALVFQLPAVEFPEGPHLADQLDYDLLRGYLAGTGRLRWSYGGVKGRSAEWQRAWGAQPTPRMVEGLAAAGYRALYVDRFGYEDRGAALDDALRPYTFGRQDQSADGRLRWYDLRPVADRLDERIGPVRRAEVGRAVLSSPSYRFPSGADSEEVDAAGSPFRRLDARATLQLFNPSPAPRRIRLSFSVRGPGGGTLRLDGAGLRAGIPASDAGTPFEEELVLAPGASRVSLATVAAAASNGHRPDGRHGKVQVVNIALADPVVERDLS